MVAEVNRQVNDWMDNCIDGWGNEQTDERLEGGLIYGLIRNLLIGDWLINWFISRLINRLIEKKKGGESTNTLNLMWGWLSVRRLLCLPCVAVKSLKRKKERHRDNLNYFSCIFMHIHAYCIFTCTFYSSAIVSQWIMAELSKSHQYYTHNAQQRGILRHNRGHISECTTLP